MTIRGKWAVGVLAALIISLSANLFVASFFFAATTAPGWHRGAGMERVVQRYTRGFPDALRQGVRGHLEARQDEFMGAFAGMREARQRAFDLMRAPDFDRAAVEAALRQVRHNVTVMQTIGHESVVEGLAEVSPDVRARIERGRSPK